MKIVYEGGVGEIVEKKSRFIATVRPVETEEQASAFIAEMKKKYWDAKHNCSAFVIGARQEMTRCSDDGEPAQTAGRPMLDVLLREELHNTAVVVTRYFGGTLLGTGGLVRAYQRAVQEGLSASRIIDKQMGRLLHIQTDYHGLGKIQHIIAARNIPVLGTDYTQEAVIHALVPMGIVQKLAEEIIEGTNGAADLVWGDEAEYAEIGREVKVFNQLGSSL